MSNSLIAFLAVMAWIPFTLFYFREEIKNFRLPGGAPAPPEAETLDMESCLGTSKQAAVAKATQAVPESSPAPAVEAAPMMPASPMEEPSEDPSAPPSVVSSVPPPTQLPEEEELPFYMSPGSGSMEMDIVRDDEDAWAFEKEDMQQSEMEEEKLETVERALREPFHSEEDDRRIAEDLHALQPFEVFNTLVRDARLRTQEILDKYPPPPPEPLPEEADPLDDVDTEEESEDGTEEEESGEGEPSPDSINDFLNNF